MNSPLPNNIPFISLFTLYIYLSLFSLPGPLTISLFSLSLTISLFLSHYLPDPWLLLSLSPISVSHSLSPTLSLLFFYYTSLSFSLSIIISLCRSFFHSFFLLFPESPGLSFYLSACLLVSLTLSPFSLSLRQCHSLKKIKQKSSNSVFKYSTYSKPLPCLTPFSRPSRGKESLG